jgi:hypothetical protein
MWGGGSFDENVAGRSMLRAGGGSKFLINPAVMSFAEDRRHIFHFPPGRSTHCPVKKLFPPGNFSNLKACLSN